MRGKESTLNIRWKVCCVVSSGILCLAKVCNTCLKRTGLIWGSCSRSVSSQLFLTKEPRMYTSCCAFVKCRRVPQASAWRERRHEQTMRREKKQTSAAARGGATACHASVLQCYFTCRGVMLMPLGSWLHRGRGDRGGIFLGSMASKCRVLDGRRTREW